MEELSKCTCYYYFSWKSRFTFSTATHVDVAKEFNILNSTKAIQEADPPVKLLKDNKDCFAAYIAKCFNDYLKSTNFPNCLKLASIDLIFKKMHLKTKSSYRPVIVLPVISKIFERIICTQLSAFWKRFFQSFNVVSVRAI